MTEMYSFRVMAVEGKRLTLRVTVEYSGEPLIPDRTLAFRFVWEPWYDLCDGVTYRPPEDRPPEPGYGEVMPPQEARERGQRAPLTRVLAGQDMNDHDWCVENADRFIACVGVTDHVNYTESDGTADDSEYDPEAKPEATYTIIATDPAWIEHLTPGMWWCTGGYAEDALPGREMYAWLTPTVASLVRGIDEDNALDRLPILADALEEAGCDDATILNHCRGASEHVRGCWALHLFQDAIRRMG
jgi:hypothetical protein